MREKEPPAGAELELPALPEEGALQTAAAATHHVLVLAAVGALVFIGVSGLSSQASSRGYGMPVAVTALCVLAFFLYDLAKWVREVVRGAMQLAHRQHRFAREVLGHSALVSKDDVECATELERRTAEATQLPRLLGALLLAMVRTQDSVLTALEQRGETVAEEVPEAGEVDGEEAAG